MDLFAVALRMRNNKKVGFPSLSLISFRYPFLLLTCISSPHLSPLTLHFPAQPSPTYLSPFSHFPLLLTSPLPFFLPSPSLSLSLLPLLSHPSTFRSLSSPLPPPPSPYLSPLPLSPPLPLLSPFSLPYAFAAVCSCCSCSLPHPLLPITSRVPLLSPSPFSLPSPPPSLCRTPSPLHVIAVAVPSLIPFSPLSLESPFSLPPPNLLFLPLPLPPLFAVRLRRCMFLM